MSIKNPIKTNDLTDVGEIADKAISKIPSDIEAGNTSGQSAKQIPSSNGTFEEQLENEINKRVQKERKK